MYFIIHNEDMHHLWNIWISETKSIMMQLKVFASHLHTNNLTSQMMNHPASLVMNYPASNIINHPASHITNHPASHIKKWCTGQHLRTHVSVNLHHIMIMWAVQIIKTYWKLWQNLFTKLQQFKEWISPLYLVLYQPTTSGSGTLYKTPAGCQGGQHRQFLVTSHNFYLQLLGDQ